MEVEQSPTTLCSIIPCVVVLHVQNVTTDVTVQTISGLTPIITVYTFRVAAVGTHGVTGPFSNPANTSVPGKC